MDACTNPDILRVIYFFLIIIDIVKIIIPIGLIVLGLIDFSKSVISSDEKTQKKSVSLFMKRILYAVLVFIVPWIVEVLMVTLGNLAVTDSNEVNFTDCIENANKEKIEELENAIEEDSAKNEQQVENNNEQKTKNSNKVCWQCNDNSSLYSWGDKDTTPSNQNCHAGWHHLNNRIEENCK